MVLSRSHFQQTYRYHFSIFECMQSCCHILLYIEKKVSHWWELWHNRDNWDFFSNYLHIYLNMLLYYSKPLINTKTFHFSTLHLCTGVYCVWTIQICHYKNHVPQWKESFYIALFIADLARRNEAPKEKKQSHRSARGKSN